MSAYRIAAITDEFTPQDLEAALRGMAAVGMTGAELRVVGGKNMIDLSDEEIDRVRATVAAHGMEVVGLASPLLTVADTSKLSVFYYFAYFLVVLPLLGRFEKPRPLPTSISESVLKPAPATT